MKQYIKYICLFLVLGMSAEMWGTDYSMTMDQNASGNNDVHITNTTANSYQDVTHSTVTWRVAWTGTGAPATGNKNQVQFGTASSPCTSVTLSTSGISGTITSVALTCYGANDNASTVSVSVGSSDFTSGRNTSVALGTGSASAKTFTGSASGTITITVSQTSTSKAIYISAVSVTYTSASPRTVTFNAEGGSCDDSSLTEASGGAGVVLPEATADCSSTGWGFYGWATTAQSSSTTTAPTIVGKAGDRYYPAADITLHAVYAKGEYTKITSTSEITSGAKYLIAGDDPTNEKFYIMGDYYFQDTYYYMEGHEFGTGNDRIEDSYQAAAVYPTWRYIITGTTDNYVIKDNSDSKYVDVWKTDWYTSSSTATNTITFGEGGYCTIANNTGGYLVVFVGGDFGDNGSAWDKMLLYKETTTPSYWSSPTCKTLTLAVTPVGGGTATFDDNSSTTMDFGSSYSGDITATPASGWDFIEWVSSNESAAIVSDDDDLTTSVLAYDDATVTAHFYQNHTVTYTLTGVTKTSGVTTVTKDEMTGFDAVFALSAHYKSPITYSVSMGGTPLTKDEDYEWNAETKTLSIVANINDDIEITITATAKTYTDYRFSCAELTLTPKLVTASTPIFITSAASKTVRSQDSILIVGNGLTPSTTLTFPGLPSKFAIKSRTGGTLQTDGSGEIDAVAYIFYTPDAGDTSDGLDKLTGITVSVGGAKPKTATLTQDIIGRHLPADFVIAVKRNNKWYALPDTMTGTWNPKPVEIAVDDIDNPTIAYTATTNVYSLYGQVSETIGGQAGYLYSNGHTIKLGMKNNGTYTNYPLFGNATGSSTLGKGGTATSVTNNIGKQYWWVLTQTNTSIENAQDAKYSIQCSNNTAPLILKENAGNPQWGFFTTGSVGPIRIIPASTSSVTFAEVEIVAWGKNSAIIEADVPTLVAHYVKGKLPGDIESEKITLSQTQTSKGTGTRYDYTVDFGEGVDFSANEGKMLTLEWYDVLDNLVAVSNAMVPRIVASNTTINSTNYPTKSVWNTEVHVLPGDTLTIDASGYSTKNKDVTIKELHIYPGAAVVINTDTLKVTNLVLRSGWSRIGEKSYGVGSLYINPGTGNGSMKATNAYMDWYIDYDQYYPIAVPWKVATASISYQNMTVATSEGLFVRYYDGERHAKGGDGDTNWKQYSWATDMPTHLVPGIGYAVTARRPAGKAFSIIRMPLTIPSADWTKDGEQGEVSSVHKDQVAVTAWVKDEGETPKHAKGWNCIANPYMCNYQGDITHSESDGEHDYDIAYVNIPDVNFKEFDQVAIDKATLKPGSAFLIQTEETGTLIFGTSNRKASAPSFLAQTPKASKQKAYITLSGEEVEDEMGLILSERYTEEYEINADLEKLLSDGNTLRTYMIYNDINMAYVAINEDLAKEWIPVTVRIPEAGEYTFSLHEASKISELEGVYLIDYETNTVTNLIGNNYSFVAAEGTIDDRFAINAIVGRHETPTDIDIINAGGDVNSDKPFKFIFNDKVFILHNGVIYDSTGKKVREINR